MSPVDADDAHGAAAKIRPLLVGRRRRSPRVLAALSLGVGGLAVAVSAPTAPPEFWRRAPRHGSPSSNRTSSLGTENQTNS